MDKYQDSVFLRNCMGIMSKRTTTGHKPAKPGGQTHVESNSGLHEGWSIVSKITGKTGTFKLNIEIRAAKIILSVFTGITFVACGVSSKERKTVLLSPDTVKMVSVDTIYFDENEVSSDYKVYEEKKR